MIRIACERHNMMGNANARVPAIESVMLGKAPRRGASIVRRRKASSVSLIGVGAGYDVAAAQTGHVSKSCEHDEVRFGHCHADIRDTGDDGRLRIGFGKFHQTLEG